jgi:RNA polymerase sigma-70 factor, ECF subfamily
VLQAMAGAHQPEHEPDADLTVTIDLLRRAQAGSDDALNRLLARYYERVRRIVKLRLGARLRQRVEISDILQETFIAAVESFDRFELRDEASFINWLAKIAERQVLAAADHHGAQKRDPGREVSLHRDDDASDARIDPPARGPLPQDLLASREQTAVVEACIAMLPEAYRELIILRTYAGASWEVVAEQTDRPSAAAARMMYAKAMIELGKAVRRALKT